MSNFNQAERFYREILFQLKANQTRPNPFFGRDYGGNNDPSLNVPTPVMRRIAKGFVKKHPDLTLSELLGILALLNRGLFDTEKGLGGILLQAYPKLKVRVGPSQVDDWLDNLRGWSQVDSLCQSVFTADDFLADWKSWKKAILRLSRSKNINKRRASLVLLTAPVRQSSDPGLRNLSFSVIDRLSGEKEILITKAISWLLRDLIKHHRSRVTAYLREKRLLLPRIAVRETKRKLATGKK